MPDVQISQFYPEYFSWLALCQAYGVKSYLEIGTESGASSVMAQKVLNARVVTLDVTHQRLRFFDPQVTYLEADSHKPSTKEAVMAVFGDTIDAVFVDGDHTQDSVEHDFELWWPKTLKLMGFHDINTQNSPGVRAAWNHFARYLRALELKIPRMQTQDSNCGIGVIMRDWPFSLASLPEDLYAYTGGKYAVV